MLSKSKTNYSSLPRVTGSIVNNRSNYLLPATYNIFYWCRRHIYHHTGASFKDEWHEIQIILLLWSIFHIYYFLLLPCTAISQKLNLFVKSHLITLRFIIRTVMAMSWLLPLYTLFELPIWSNSSIIALLMLPNYNYPYDLTYSKLVIHALCNRHRVALFIDYHSLRYIYCKVPYHRKFRLL